MISNTPPFYIFEVDKVLFQINTTDVKKLKTPYKVLNCNSLFNKKNWKVVKTKRCKKKYKKVYLSDDWYVNLQRQKIPLRRQ